MNKIKYLNFIFKNKIKKRTLYYKINFIDYMPFIKKKIYSERYFYNNKLHNSDHPAVIYYYYNGNIESEYYFNYGDVHRENGPAVTYYKNGSVYKQWYCLNSKIHNDNGPAIIDYNEDGSIKEQHYFLNGEEYTDVLKYMVLAGYEKENI